MRTQVVSFHCVLKTQTGKLISSTTSKDVITQAHGQGDMLQGLARALQDVKAGEKRRVCLAAPEAYGYYDPDKVIELSNDELSKEKPLKKGDKVVASSKDGQNMTYRVVETQGDRVILDANHPLAGQDLVFEIETISAREATLDEIAESEVEMEEELLH